MSFVVKVLGVEWGNRSHSVNTLRCYPTFLINAGTSGPPAEGCPLDSQNDILALKTWEAGNQFLARVHTGLMAIDLPLCAVHYFGNVQLVLDRILPLLKEIKAVCHQCH